MIPYNHCILCRTLLLLLSIFPSIKVKESALLIRGPKYWGSASVLVLLVNIQCWFPLGLTGLIYFCPRDSQESSPAPQFKSISSSVLSLLYGPTITLVHDYQKNHSFHETDLCWQNDVSYFLIYCIGCLCFSSKEQVCFNFMAAVTICSDFGGLQNKIRHYFHFFPIFPEVMGPDAMILVF